MKIFGTETRQFYFGGPYMWRYYSLYNGARGAWVYSRADAEKEGEAHAEVIRALIAGGSERSSAQQGQPETSQA